MNIKKNKQERAKFIDKWVEYMKKVSDKKWSKQQKTLIDSQIKNARHWNKEIKKKILVDLDVVTLAFWDKKDEAKLIGRIKAGEFEIYTPYSLLDLIEKWKYKTLKNKIKEFYELYSSEIITAQKLTKKLDEINLKETNIINDLKKEQVKDEDIILIVITSIFQLDYLITFNRKHLKNKKGVINNVLQKYKLKTIKIILPNEA